MWLSRYVSRAAALAIAFSAGMIYGQFGAGIEGTVKDSSGP
jgi:hypothetical protein